MHHQALHGAFVSSPCSVQPLPLLALALPYRFASQRLYSSALCAKTRSWGSLAAIWAAEQHLGGVLSLCIVDSSAARHENESIEILIQCRAFREHNCCCAQGTLNSASILSEVVVSRVAPHTIQEVQVQARVALTRFHRSETGEGQTSFQLNPKCQQRTQDLVGNSYASYPSTHANPSNSAQCQRQASSSLGHKAPRYMQMPTGYNDEVKHLISAPGAAPSR